MTKTLKVLIDITRIFWTAANAREGSTWLRAGVGTDSGTPELLVTPDNTLYSGFVVGATPPATFDIIGLGKDDGQPEIADFQAGQYVAYAFSKLTISGVDGVSIQCIKA